MVQLAHVLLGPLLQVHGAASQQVVVPLVVLIPHLELHHAGRSEKDVADVKDFVPLGRVLVPNHLGPCQLHFLGVENFHVAVCVRGGVSPQARGPHHGDDDSSEASLGGTAV